MYLQGLLLASAALQHEVDVVSFHPADMSCLLAINKAPSIDESVNSSSSSTDPHLHLWRLEKLWSRHELIQSIVHLPGARCAVCHAWAPEGVYVGCLDGSIVCLEPESSALLFEVATARSTAPSAVSSLAVNKEALVVASTAASQLSFYSRPLLTSSLAPSKQHQQQQLSQSGPSNVQCLGSITVCTTGKS